MNKSYKSIIDKCFGKGIELYVEHGKLKYKSMSGQLPEDILNELKLNKLGLIKYIEKEQNKYSIKDLYDSFPLSPVQSAYLFGRGDLYSYGNVACHIYQEFSYDNLDPTRVQAVCNHLISKHSMLRAIIHQEGYQEILKDVPKYEIINNERAVIRKQLESKIYPLENWPMFDIGLSYNEGKSILHFSMDFMIADWSSIWTLLTQFEDLYFNKFEDFELPEVSFRDYMLYEEKEKRTLKYISARDYWNKKMDSLKAAPTLPTQIDQNEVSPKFERFSMILEKNLWDTFKNISQKNAITPTAAVLTLYGEVLKKWSLETEFSLNLTLFNKKHIGKDISNLIGDFTNTSIISIKNSKTSFTELARDINREIFNNLDNSSYSGVEVLRDLAKLNNTKEFLLPYVFTSAIGLIQKGLQGKYVYGISQTPQVFIDCQVMDTDLGLQINWDIRKNIFHQDIIEDMLEIFEKTLNKLSKCEAMWNESLNLPIPKWQLEERQKSNATKKIFKKNTLLTDFLKNVKTKPNKIAVINSGRKLSYQELYNKAVSIALALKDKYVQKGDFVIIKLPHNVDQLASVLGILMLGAIYVPLDINTCKKRFESILKQCNSKVVLTSDGINGNELNINNIKMDLGAVEEFKIENINPDDTAYVIFTSGTTGVPKGVLISHWSALNTIYDINERFNITKEDSILAISKLTFDLSVYDIFGILSAGGTIVYPNEYEYLNPAHWDELVKKYSITLWNTVPALMDLYLSYLKNSGEYRESIKLILLSGDWIPLKMPALLQKLFLNAKFIALGGATEASIWSIYHEYKCLKENWVSIPYGKPLSNQQFFVLDENLDDCPVYCEGNLYIAGEGLAKGYLGDEELTKRKFFIHYERDIRLYSTGDMGRYLPGGEIEFLGRKDTQVKIRGYRIELGEIKHALINQKEILKALVSVNKEKQDLPIEAIVTINLDKTIKNDLSIIPDINEEIKRYKKLLCNDNYKRICKLRDEICLYSLLNALLEVGIFKKGINNKYYYDEYNIQNINTKYTWIVDRVIKQLEIFNMIKNTGDNQYKILNLESKSFINEKWDEIFAKWDEAYGNMNFLHYIKRNTDNLVNLLVGTVDPVDLLYPNGLNVYTEALYENSINSIVINKFYCSFLKEYAKKNNQRKIRILEIGAGTGATTKKLIEILGDIDYEYHFTDSQKYFLPAARNYFKDNNRISVYQYNIDKEPIEQGIEYNYFDIIIGAYVIENAKDIPKSLNFIKKIIAPKGYLLFSEPLRNEPWILSSQILLMEEPQDKLRTNTFYLNFDQWLNVLSSEKSRKETLVFPQDKELLNVLGVALFVKQFKCDYMLIDREKIYQEVSKEIPSYMLPTSIFYADSFKLNNNSKVDLKQNFNLIKKLNEFKNREDLNKKNNLNETQNLNPLENEISKICSELLGVEQLNKNTNFYDYGADSLIMAKISTDLKNKLKFSIPFEVILKNIILNPTVESIAKFFKEYSLNKENVKKENNEFVLAKLYKSNNNKNKSKLRVFIYGAFGNSQKFDNLAIELANQGEGDVVTVGVFDIKKFLNMNSKDIVPILADSYCKKILEFGSKNVQLIGYCFGGVLSIEIAKRLLYYGIYIENLSIIEGGSTSEITYDELILEFIFLQAFNVELYDFNIIEKNIMENLYKNINLYNNTLFIEDILKNIHLENDRKIILDLEMKSQNERFKIYFKILSQKQNSLSEKSLFESYKIFKKSLDAQRFIPDLYFGDIDYYIAQDNVGAYKHFDLILKNWEEVLIGKVNKYYIPGNHYSSVENVDNVSVLANLLKY